MNTVVTSRQALLAASRTVARRQGLGGLSIRAVAAEARVSVGSVYNYFSGKTELLAATVEEIWMQILSAPEGEAPRDGFAAYVHWLFHRIQSGAGEYPGFFQGHAAGFLPEGRSAGRRTMAEALGRVRQTLLEALEASTYCTPDALGGFPQVSGIQFTIDTGKSYDAGALYPDSTYHAPKSINRVTIQSVGGKAFDEKAVYTIATNDFMAAGGDTYYAFKAASANYNIGVPMDEVLMDYIKTELKGVVGETYVKPQGRITLTKTEAPAEEPAKPAEPAQPSTPAQPAKPADGDGGETSYTVVSGDCLWNIAYRHYGSGAKFTMIAEANGLKDPYLINIGQVLVIPAA